MIGGPARSTVADVPVEHRPHAQLQQEVVGHLAQVIRREHLLVVGHRLVADIRIDQDRHEVRQQEQGQAQRVNRDREDQDQPEHPREEDHAVPERELEVVQLLGVVLDPVGGPGPEQVDDDHGDELEEIQIETRAPQDVGRLGQNRGEELGGVGPGDGAENRQEDRREHQERANHCGPFLGASPRAQAKWRQERQPGRNSNPAPAAMSFGPALCAARNDRSGAGRLDDPPANAPFELPAPFDRT